MRSISTGVAGFFALLTLIASAHAQPRTPREALEESHPGVRFYEVGERVARVYGVRMTAGKTADEAVANWLGLYGEILNNGREGGGPDLRQSTRLDLIDGRIVFSFRQHIDNVPVDGALVR